MNAAELLVDGFGRVRELVHSNVDGASADVLTFRPGPDANSIAWLVWHLTRIQDDHLAAAFGGEQVWTARGWYERFGLPFEPSAHGYGQSSADVAAVDVTMSRLREGPSAAAELLTGYHDAVYEQTVRYLGDLRDQDLARVVDDAWDPPVTLAVRLVSVLSDDLQHIGQASYIAGLRDA